MTLPAATQHAIADLWTSQVALVQAAAADAERELAAHRENVARAAFLLLREFADRPGEPDDAMRKRLIHASRAATAALNALGANGGFVSKDRRGNTDAKRLLLDVAEQAVALYLPQRTKVKRRPDAYVNDEGARRGAQVSDAEAAERIAFILHWFGLGDAACVGMFGLPPVDAPDAMRKSVEEFLETNRGSPILRVDELCGRALVAAGLLTPKERSGFFLIGRTERRRPRGPA